MAMLNKERVRVVLEAAFWGRQIIENDASLIAGIALEVLEKEGLFAAPATTTHPTAYDLARELERELLQRDTLEVDWPAYEDDEPTLLGLGPIGLDMLEKHIKKAIELGREMERQSAALSGAKS